jgi:hypothetical protein
VSIGCAQAPSIGHEPAAQPARLGERAAELVVGIPALRALKQFVGVNCPNSWAALSHPRLREELEALAGGVGDLQT